MASDLISKHNLRWQECWLVWFSEPTGFDIIFLNALFSRICIFDPMMGNVAINLTLSNLGIRRVDGTINSGNDNFHEDLAT